MEKAWDLKDLGNRLKGKIAPVAAIVAADVIDWTAESIQKNENKYVQLLAGIVIAVKQPVIDEINRAVSQMPMAVSNGIVAG